MGSYLSRKNFEYKKTSVKIFPITETYNIKDLVKTERVEYIYDDNHESETLGKIYPETKTIVETENIKCIYFDVYETENLDFNFNNS